MKNIILLFLLTFSINSNGGAVDVESTNCLSVISSIEERQSSILSQNMPDRFTKADEEWNRANLCAASLEEKAMMADLYGDIAYFAYTSSGGKADLFDMSMEAYKKALSYNAMRSGTVHLHLARLLNASGSHDKAVEQIQLAKSVWVGDTYLYWAYAFRVYADAGNWKEAGTAFFVLTKKDKEFYSDPALMLAAVKVYCHYGQLENAMKMIQSNEEYMRNSGNASDKSWGIMLKTANEVVKSCPKQISPV